MVIEVIIFAYDKEVELKDKGLIGWLRLNVEGLVVIRGRIDKRGWGYGKNCLKSKDYRFKLRLKNVIKFKIYWSCGKEGYFMWDCFCDIFDRR